MSALPSINDLARNSYVVSQARDVISAAAENGGFDAKSLSDHADSLWADRWAALIDLILTMPAQSLADAAVQLHAMLAKVQEADDDDWPREAKVLLKVVRRGLISTALITSRAAGIDLDVLGYVNLPDIHGSEFPPTMVSPGPANAAQESAGRPTPPPDDDENDLMELAEDYLAAAAEVRSLEAANGTRELKYVPLDARRHNARRELTETKATSMAGLRAKAMVYLGEVDLAYGPPARIDDRDTLDLLADSIARDVRDLTG